MILASNVIQNENYNLSVFFRNQTINQIFFNMDLIQRLITLITSVLTTYEIKIQAINCLALYSKYHEEIALLLMNQGIIELLSTFIVENDTTGFLERISWLFAILSTVHISKTIVSVHFTHIVKFLNLLKELNFLINRGLF